MKRLMKVALWAALALPMLLAMPSFSTPPSAAPLTTCTPAPSASPGAYPGGCGRLRYQDERVRQPGLGDLQDDRLASGQVADR